MLLSPQSGSHGGLPEANLRGHVFGHTVRPNWNPDLHSNFVVFLILVTLVGCRFASFLVPFLVHFGRLWAPFCIILEPFGVLWASLEGSLEEGCFFIDFWRPNWSQSGAPEAPKIHSKWVQNSIVFLIHFLTRFGSKSEPEAVNIH